MRMLVTGKYGQLPRSLQERGATFGAEIVLLGRPEFDLADIDRSIGLIEAARPDIVVSAAAYTAVDKAEGEPQLAFAVNADGPRAIATAAAKIGVPLIQISTDYVFDGTKSAPWTEADVPAPINIYGASKLAGERAVMAASPGNLIIRVGWVYSPFGANFAKTIVRLAGERDSLRVVADQIGAPTSALDIADGVLMVAQRVLREPSRAELRGLLHMGASGEATWAEFARMICDWLGARTGRSIPIENITTAEYPTAARRPANSLLDSGRLARVHDVRMPSWWTSAEQVLPRLVDARISTCEGS